jgi:hypothetical protein
MLVMHLMIFFLRTICVTEIITSFPSYNFRQLAKLLYSGKILMIYM